MEGTKSLISYEKVCMAYEVQSTVNPANDYKLDSLTRPHCVTFLAKISLEQHIQSCSHVETGKAESHARKQ